MEENTMDMENMFMGHQVDVQGMPLRWKVMKSVLAEPGNRGMLKDFLTGFNVPAKTIESVDIKGEGLLVTYINDKGIRESTDLRIRFNGKSMSELG
jgi:hypothetical protein